MLDTERCWARLHSDGSAPEVAFGTAAFDRLKVEVLPVTPTAKGHCSTQASHTVYNCTSHQQKLHTLQPTPYGSLTR